jgi:hypothetical protein
VRFLNPGFWDVTNLNGANTMCLRGSFFPPNLANSSNFCTIRTFSSRRTVSFCLSQYTVNFTPSILRGGHR